MQHYPVNECFDSLDPGEVSKNTHYYCRNNSGNNSYNNSINKIGRSREKPTNYL